MIIIGFGYFYGNEKKNKINNLIHNSAKNKIAPSLSLFFLFKKGVSFNGRRKIPRTTYHKRKFEIERRITT